MRGSPAAALICDSLVVERLDGLTERVLWAVLEYPDPIRRREPGQVRLQYLLKPVGKGYFLRHLRIYRPENRLQDAHVQAEMHVSIDVHRCRELIT